MGKFQETCHLPVVAGKCQAYFHRFYFNSSTQSCKEFIYGGCGGNSNNFKTKTECEMTCKSVCQRPLIAGDCDQEIPSYGWNMESGNCEYFIYSGCGGNGNKFQSQRDCLEMCGPPRACQQDPSEGTCGENLPRFFYNQTAKACEEFQYSGCEANDNNFRTLWDCEERCLAAHSICHLEPEKGICDGKVPRFYYDPSKKKCLKFFYGGCEGNENNFKELQDCEEECGGK
ncbi:actinia tenebrosa protease inhibitors [Patella vulgata]|uniref:actinia tenebrosa protease inhibitors n=1 Tax=Patella vulgata TaxID=6465 RepID=UPI0024A95BB8|nr:actinia tenebrosa protease inhibitors [Patella vulgata]